MAAFELFARGGQLQLADGRRFLAKGINWFGLETEDQILHGLWGASLESFLDLLASQRFNFLRVPVAVDNVLGLDSIRPTNFHQGENPGLIGKTLGEIVDVAVAEAGKRGLLVMFDMHRLRASGGIGELWHDGGCDEATVARAWQALAGRYRGSWNVVAADLMNEPHGCAAWGGPDARTDWASAAERLGEAVAAVAPHWLVVVEGVQGGVGNWGGIVAGAIRRPVRHSVPDKVAYAPHCYGPGVTGRDVGEAEWIAEWASLKRAGLTVMLGEWGGRSQGPDAAWQQRMAAFLKSSDLTDQFYWGLNPNSGDTGGLLLDDWKTLDQFKCLLLQQLVPRPTDVLELRGGGGGAAGAASARTALLQQQQQQQQQPTPMPRQPQQQAPGAGSAEVVQRPAYEVRGDPGSLVLVSAQDGGLDLRVLLASGLEGAGQQSPGRLLFRLARDGAVLVTDRPARVDRG